MVRPRRPAPGASLMPMIPMRALVDLVHEGRAVSAGDTFESAAVTAAVLRYQHRAEFATVALPPKSTRTKRTYKRRDLRAES